MKRFLAAMLLSVAFASNCYAVSEDLYIRQDVFEAKMEALFNRIHSEIVELKGDIKALAERVEGVNASLSGRIIGLDYKIDVLQTVIYWGLSIIGLLVAFAIFAPSLSEFLRSIRKPSLSAEEIKQLIEQTINTRIQGSI